MLFKYIAVFFIMPKNKKNKICSEENNNLSFLGPVTNSILDLIIEEIKKTKTKEKIMENIIDPLLKDLSIRYYPHFIIITIALIMIIILLISILVINVLGNQLCKK